MPGTHLTQAERYCLQEFLRLGYPLSAIGAILGRDRTTLWREVERNRNYRGAYEGHHANCLARDRRSFARRNRRLTADDWACVRVCLEQEWSPRQIAERFATFGILRISASSIYAWLHRTRRHPHSLWKQLRQGHRQRRRRAGQQRRPSVRGPSIRTRPVAIERRDEVGHWELDTMVGTERTCGILTAVERVTGWVVIGKLEALTAEALTARAIQLLRDQPHPVRSLTMDNGPEMSGWRRLQVALHAPCFFTDPYSAWQRGTNENTNGLIRQYIPKKTSMAQLTQRDCTYIANRLNTRPRERLGWLTPEECYVY
jgi:transposase, IS30 family